MKKEKYYSGTTSFWKRVGSSIADAVIFLMITMSLFGVAVVPILKVATPLLSYMDAQKTALKKASNLYVESRLLTYDEDEKEVPVDKYIDSLLPTYLSEEISNQNGEYNDLFLYFFVTFNEENLTFDNDKDRFDIARVNTDVYKVNDENNKLFALRDGDINKPLIFKEDAKSYLSEYLAEEYNANSEEYHTLYMDFMSEAWKEASMFLGNSDNYKVYAKEFDNYQNKTLAIYTYSSLILFTLIFFIYYFIIPLCLKKGQTLAKKILHIGLFYEDNRPIDNGMLFVRSFLQYIFYSFLLIIVPYLQIGNGIIYMPLIMAGDYIFYLFSLTSITFILFIINGIYMAVNNNHRCLYDKLLSIYAKKDSPEFLDEEDNRPNNVIEQEAYDRGS